MASGFQHGRMRAMMAPLFASESRRLYMSDFITNVSDASFEADVIKAHLPQ